MEDPVGYTNQKEHAHGLNRSCEACRGRKIRCVQPAANNLTRRCARCEKMGINCVFLAPSARQRKKRVDGRVAELEREVREMRKKFASDDIDKLSENGIGEMGLKGVKKNKDTCSNSTGAFALTSAGVDNIPLHYCPQSPTQPLTTSTFPSKEVIVVEGVTEQTATQLFNKYKTELAPHFPLLHFPSRTSAGEFNQEKPTLFLAILAATSISVDPVLARSLNSQLEKVYTDKIFVNGEKSLELVQSLLVSVVWYNPPTMFKDLKFTQYVHMAANMALDIHIGMRVGSQVPESPKGSHDVAPSISPMNNSLESQRTLVGCYVLCSSIAMALCRPNMLKHSSRTAVCIQDIAKSDIQSDIHLSSWAKLQHAAEESAIALGLDDHQSRADFSDFHTQSSLRDLDERITKWKEEVDWRNLNSSLKIHFHFVRAKLHEAPLYLEYEPEEFSPPYLMRLRPSRLPNKIELSPAHIKGLKVCIRSTHALLDVILSMSPEKTRCLPVIAYTRMLYAVIVLIKLGLCADNPDSSIGAVLDADNLKVSFYLSTVKVLLQAAIGKENFSVPTCFLAVHDRITAWYQGHDSQAPDSIDNLLEPLAHLTTTNNSDESYNPVRMVRSEHSLHTGNTQNLIQSNNDCPISDLDMIYDHPGLSSGFLSDPFEAFPFGMASPREVGRSTSGLAEFSPYGLNEDYNFQDSMPWGQQFPEPPRLGDFGFYSSNCD